MISFDWYSLCALGLVAFTFYRFRTIRSFLIISVVVGIGFGIATSGLVARSTQEIALANVGLWLYILGLLIVRTMLKRSVSLHLLFRISSGHRGVMAEDIETRLEDLHRFALVDRKNGMNALTIWGRLVSSFVAIVYKIAGMNR